MELHDAAIRQILPVHVNRIVEDHLWHRVHAIQESPQPSATRTRRAQDGNAKNVVVLRVNAPKPALGRIGRMNEHCDSYPQKRNVVDGKLGNVKKGQQDVRT
jgi:hypothetical protein